MNATSRLSRASLATATSHFVFFAAFSCGRRSSASAPLPVSTSVNSAKRWMVAAKTRFETSL
jgi:hypothetical protein